MRGRVSLRGPQGIVSAVVALALVLALSITLMPSASDVLAALRRSRPLAAPVPAPSTAAGVPVRTPEVLASMFAKGQPLLPGELRQLLFWSTKSASADTLTSIASQLALHDPVPTAQVTYDILASGRADVALAFLEGRADRDIPANWLLRLNLHRQANDLPFAQAMVRRAASTPGVAPAADFVQGAYAAGLPGELLTAAERRIIPPLDKARSLDLARQAQATGRSDLIARIDRAGTPDWRSADPWLAMTVAQDAGNVAGALHYAGLLHNGAVEARRAIVLASRDQSAIRAMLIEDGRSKEGNLPSAAQQLLAAGFRTDAIALLQEACSRCAPGDPLAARLLFLMGPRPGAAGLAWLRGKADADTRWLKAYIDRASPATALAFLQARPERDDIAMLLDRLRLAGAARDKAAAAQALDRLLDGRSLSAEEARAVTAATPAGLDRRTGLALAHMRARSGAELPNDRLDMAYDAWGRRDLIGARDHLVRHLSRVPGDPAALSFMAEIERRRLGDKAARLWLEKALAATPGATIDRARLLEQLGRFDEALPLVRGLQRATPTDRRLQAMAGRLLVATGDPGRARKELQP